MTIARVIVDVPVLATDKPFDYIIPEEWQGLIEPGMRVIVPFGNRKVQGFVVKLEDQSEHPELKAIIEPMDERPVLNEELLALGDWLSHHTLCLKISAFQVMLPPALKAKYEKRLSINSDINGEQMPPHLRLLFQDKKEINWNEAIQKVNINTLYRDIRKGIIDVRYEIKNKANKKKEIFYVPAQEKEKFYEELANVSKNATKQQEIIRYFIEHFQAHSKKELEKAIGNIANSINGLIKKGLIKKEEQEKYRDPYENKKIKKSFPHPLTSEQEEAIKPIWHAIAHEQSEVFLLYGVTGSGKTEVYLQTIQKVIEKGKEAIVLVPEISLTPQMVTRFKSRFGDKVAVLHSGLSIGEKYDEWRKIQRKEVQVVVGARSAIFAPFENLGVIIIDEEHETSYKQEDVPRYHARDVAIERAKTHHCPVILGSATPSLESFARAQKGVYHLLKMEKRMNKMPLPTVEIIDMREELHEGNRLMFSRRLLEKIEDRLKKNEQIVLLLNRRGYASFMMCRDCGYTLTCPHCEVSLTYHKVNQQVKCHYCGYERLAPNRCPECHSEHIRYFGTGTQKVEEQLGKLFPEARVIRMDVDTTQRKGAHEKLLTSFQEGKGDILLGTQMIAKGLDFPNITLVGVLAADTILNLPDFRSSEKTFQLLTQVSGRAGRHQLPGEVIIQTYTPDHYSIQMAKEHNFIEFYRYEMAMRKKGQYPPYYYLALIQVSHENVLLVVDVIEKIASFLRKRLSSSSKVLGPAASPITKVKNRYRYQVLIKYKHDPNLIPTLQQISNHFFDKQMNQGLSITIDLNPFSMM